MTRTVILPKELDEKLTDLTILPNEVVGVLLYQKVQDGREEYCPIDYPLVLGVGSEGEVEPRGDNVQIANEFFRRNPGYGLVRFHTHTEKTVEDFGDYFARNFSRTDKESIRTARAGNPDHLEMLVTPETKLIDGADNPKLAVVDNLPDYQERNRHVHESLQNIARENGYEFGELYLGDMKMI